MRKSLWITLLVVTMLLTACSGGAAKPAPAAPGSSPGGLGFVMSLPRVEINLDQNGQPSLMGIKLSDAGALLGQNFNGIGLDKPTLDHLVGAGVQHIEARQTGAGLEFLVNGKLMPHVGWTDDSLAQAGRMAAVFDVSGAQTLIKVLPIIRRLGVDVAIRLPKVTGAANIPLAPIAPSVPLSATAPISPTAVVRTEITYDDDGVPSILGVSATDLAKLGIDVPGQLSPDLIQKLKANDIQILELRTTPNGLTVYANNQALPDVQWNQEMLANAADLYNQLNPGKPYADLIKAAPPFVRGADIDVLMHLPRSADKPAIPAQTH
jgi:hypothetical protein